MCPSVCCSRACEQVLAKMRAELKAVYGPDNTRPYTHELMRSLPYTEMVMKEILRFRPPAPLVPHISSVDFPLTPDYTIPKGTIVFPSLLESSFQVHHALTLLYP